VLFTSFEFKHAHLKETEGFWPLWFLSHFT